MSISVRVIGLLVCLTAVEGCMSNQTGVYHDVGESPSFSFSVALPVSGIQSFAVGKEGSNSFLSFSYNSGTLINQNVGNGITFTGDFALGDISFTIDSIQLNDGGTYSLKNILKSETLECKMLTVRGVVSVTLSVTNNPAETHQQVMFVCEANSTTEPPVSSFTYTWSAKSEPLTASADARYTLSGNRLTLADAKTTDSGKYMCIAEENIPSGDTASGEVFLTVNGSIMPTTSTTTTSATTQTTTTSATLTSNTTPVLQPAATTTAVANTISTFRTSAAANSITDNLAATSLSAIMTVTSTIKTEASSDQALIVMIIVVSVIGGILVLAIFVLMFLLVHWKNCFPDRAHHQHRVHSSDYTRKVKDQNRFNAGGAYSTTQMENKFKNYYFYQGKINPVYDGMLVTNNCCSNEGSLQEPEYTEQLAAGFYQYDYDWEQMNRH